MTIERQAELMPDHAAFVENARFMHEQVMVVTADIVGWNDKLPKHSDDIVEAYLMREAANIAGIRSSIAKAQQDGAKGLVMAIQADLWKGETELANWPHASIHESWTAAFLKVTDDFGKPVLLVHGDSHAFQIDHPFIDERDGDSPLIMRLQVYGDE